MNMTNETKEFTHSDIIGLGTPRLGMIGSSILWTILNSLPQDYCPDTNALAMALGTSNCSREGSLIREIHKRKFGIEKMCVIGCDIRTRPSELTGKGNDGDFDYELRGEIEGGY